MAKNPRKLELGPANVYITQKPRADAFIENPAEVRAFHLSAGQGVDAQLQLTATKRYPGTKGNAVHMLITVAAGTNPLTITNDGTVASPIINIRVATTGGVGISTPNDVIAVWTLKANSAIALIATPTSPTGTGASALLAEVDTAFTAGVGSVDVMYYVQSVRPGAGFDVEGNELDYSGNAITVAHAAGASLSVSVSGTDITVKVPANTTSDQVILALRNSPEASYLVTASRPSFGVGTGVVDVTIAAITLSGGSGANIRTDVGFLGDEVAYQVTTEATNLTGAQTGNVPQDKVVIGGMVRVVIPFKEISLENLQAGVPSATIVSSSGGDKRRVDFHVAVGASMRQTLTVQMEIIKIKGGFESPLAVDKIVIPSISPAEGEVNFPFAPVTQRVIMTNWYAWPNPDTGRWAFFGDEFP